MIVYKAERINDLGYTERTSGIQDKQPHFLIQNNKKRNNLSFH